MQETIAIILAIAISTALSSCSTSEKYVVTQKGNCQIITYSVSGGLYDYDEEHITCKN